MTQNDLVEFNELKAEITAFVAPVMSIAVIDAASSVPAIETAKSVKAYLNAVEKKRKELVGPLNDRVKQINEYVKSITAPLTKAEDHIRAQLNAFATKQEEIRQAALRKAEEERREMARKIEEERKAAEEALKAKQAEKAVALSAAENLFGAGESETVAEKQAKEQAELEAKFKTEMAVKKGLADGIEWDAQQLNIKNTRTVYYCELIDINQVPKEFLIVTLNEAAVKAAAKAGVKDIPGVKITSKQEVAIGSKTRVTKEMIGG